MEIRRIPISLINPAPYNPRKDLQPGDLEYERLRLLIGQDPRLILSDDGWIREIVGKKKQKLRRLYGHICPECGSLFLAPKGSKYCGKTCLGRVNGRRQVEEWNITAKARLITSRMNKTLEHRKAVAEGLRRRKERLGENYHSPETKRKIGIATRERWGKIKDKLLPALKWNGESRKKDGFPYGHEWRHLSKEMRENCRHCARCLGSHGLVLHYLIPARFGGQSDLKNSIVLCNRCHQIVEYQTLAIQEIIGDWEITRALVRQSLMAEWQYWQMKRLEDKGPGGQVEIST